MSARRDAGATLACEARGDAPLRLTWSRDGAPLDLSTYRLTCHIFYIFYFKFYFLIDVVSYKELKDLSILRFKNTPTTVIIL